MELALDSLEEVTEAESESEKMLLDMPPGGLRTLQKKKKVENHKDYHQDSRKKVFFSGRLDGN